MTTSPPLSRHPIETLHVGLGPRSYPILIGNGLFPAIGEWTADLAGRRFALITNTIVAPHYLDHLQGALNLAGHASNALVLPDGEATKCWETLNRIHDWLLAERFDRSSIIVALGGGVIGDLAGFAAATYQRGINFIQVPTTLLAQVDSSVGGKTGINHPRGKNMIGAFWQPRLVLADTSTLDTLPSRELSAGLAEVIKYGLIRDLPFLEWLENHLDDLIGRDPEALAYAIGRSCQNKAEVVAADELEQAHEGGRALLNLGHTFGHAIETGTGYGTWLHGEAVAAGTVMAAELSHRLGWLAREEVTRVRQLLVRAGLPVTGPRLGAERYLDLMGHDKKVIAGKLRLVLLREMGQAVTWADTPRATLVAAIDACCE